MKNPIIVLSAIVLTCLVGCKKCNYYNMPTGGVTQGGRTVAIVVHPNQPNTYLAATETGGVFKTTDGGKLWKHLDNLPNHSTFDIKYCPSNPDIVVVTTREDNAVRNGGGIWVSRDGGENWTHPPSALPAAPSGLPVRYSAYGISFMPGTEMVVVGTDSGIAVSDNLGADWRYVNPEPSGAKVAVHGVLAQRSGRVLTYGDGGIWISASGFSGWIHDDTGIANGWDIPHVFAVSPKSDDHIFFTNGWESLFYSMDGGRNWRPIPVSHRWYDGRQPYVKIVNSTTNDQDAFDLYYSNMSLVGKKVIRFVPGSGGAADDYDFTNPWNTIPFLHPDPADLAFAADGKTLLLAANDGGVEKSTDNGTTWSIISRPDNFFNALQVYDVKGTFYSGTPARTEIYFGTQDNYLWASGNGGNNWPYATGAEGFHIEGPVTYNSTTDSLMSYVNIGSCNQCISNPLWRSPREVTRWAPVMSGYSYVHRKTWVAFGKNEEWNLRSFIFISTDGASTWNPAPSSATVSNINFPLVGYYKVAGPEQNPSLFVPFIADGVWGSTGTYALMRYDNLFDGVNGNETRRRIGLPPDCNLGIVPTMFPWYVMYAVDPNNADFMILPDVKNKIIWKTTSGGAEWTEDRALYDMVTGSGAYHFHYDWARPQVRCINFDPKNSEHIAVGTFQAGVIYSRNRGNTWIKLPASEKIPYVTSFFFQDDTSAIASTYGRGLVQTYLRETPVASAAPPKTVFHLAQLNPPSKDPAVVKGVELPDVPSDTTSPFLVVNNGNWFSPGYFGFAGKNIPIRGYRWAPGVELQVWIDNNPVKVQIIPAADGSFKAELPALQQPKVYTLTISQRKDPKSKEITIQSAPLTIAVYEAEENQPKK